MTDYETQLRDEFAKMAFEKALEKLALTNEVQVWKDAHLGYYSYHLADKAMQARKSTQEPTP